MLLKSNDPTRQIVKAAFFFFKVLISFKFKSKGFCKYVIMKGAETVTAYSIEYLIF